MVFGDIAENDHKVKILNCEAFPHIQEQCFSDSTPANLSDLVRKQPRALVWIS